ncbi:Cell division control protein 25 [Sphaceloma murrayae]|uniref:Cell division control protein 25 n=1 Tax=Sphaceloma murrayae TaxID=2082308 RepID=A0A2K1QTI3_9PEZI|nr:Cell division control protein 25 [Sphaceloma murrayae]
MTEQQKSTDNVSQMPSIPPLELGDMSMSNTSPAATDVGPTGKSELAEEQVTQGAAQSAVDESEAGSMGARPSAEHTQTDKAGPLPPPINTTAPALTRQVSEAIGPSTDLPTPMLKLPESALAAGPVVQFTLLLASTGTRHPFQLNEKYLTKRNVTAKGEDGAFDPSCISVYNLKELILKDWRDDWDHKPSSPSAIRLIFFGQLLADNVSLKECKLQTDGTPNVLHITVKPQEVMDDEEAGKGKSSMSRDRDGGDRTPGCRCVIL